MDKILEMRNELNHVLRSAKDILEKAEKEDRELTEDEEKSLADFSTRSEDLEKKIAVAEKAKASRSAITAKLEALQEPTSKRVDIHTAGEVKTDNTSHEFTSLDPVYRASSLRSFKGPHAEQRAYASGQWLRSVLFGDAKCLEWCNQNLPQFRDHATNINAKGGALVPDVLASTIIDLREQYGVFRQNVRVVPMTSDTLTFPRRTGGLTTYWVGEGVETTSSDTAWDNVQLTAKKLAALTKLSTEVAEDAIVDLADWLAGEIAYQFAYEEDRVGFMGTGLSTDGKITGVLSAIEAQTTYVGYVNATSGDDTFEEVLLADINSMMSKLPLYARANAKFYVSQQGYDAMLARLAYAAGGNTTTSIAGGFGLSFNGYPVVISQVFPTSSLNNQVMLLFGDLSLACTMGDRRGMRIGTSDQRYFELDQIGILGTERIDIVTHDIGDATNAGPVVALIANT